MLKKLLLTGCMLFMAGNLFAANNPHVVMDTSFGEIELELEAEKAPITVENRKFPSRKNKKRNKLLLFDFSCFNSFFNNKNIN